MLSIFFFLIWIFHLMCVFTLWNSPPPLKQLWICFITHHLGWCGSFIFLLKQASKRLYAACIGIVWKNIITPSTDQYHISIRQHKATHFRSWEAGAHIARKQHEQQSDVLFFISVTQLCSHNTMINCPLIVFWNDVWGKSPEMTLIYTGLF